MRHEESTDAAQPVAEQERPSGLAALRVPNAIGLGVSFTPDESDLNGSVTYSHDRLTQLVAELFRRTASMMSHNDQIANFVQPMVSREEHEALLADVEGLRARIAAVESQTRRVAA